MIVRVWRQASKARLLERVIVATDDERIARAVRDAGGDVEMTASTHQSGTDRIAEVAGAMRNDDTIAMATLAAPILDPEEWRNPNKVKIVCDERGDALYFSRSPIPFLRDGTGVPANALRHVAVYGYRRDFLLKFASLKPGVLEQVEKLEQLRAMERGYRIKVVASVAPSLEVDTPEDLARANEAAKGMR